MSRTFRTDVHAFRAEFNAFRTEVYSRFEQIDARFEQIDARFEKVDARFDALEQLVHDGHDRLSSQMRMLHEELIERIRTMSEGRDSGGPAPSRPGRRKRS